MTMGDEHWVSKYRPKSFDEIQGNNTALRAIENWAEHWTPGDKPQLLIGSPGTGKTTTAFVVREKMGWTLNQVNASDKRTTEDIRELASTLTSNPYANRQLVLLDEIDSIPGRTNLTPLVKALKMGKCPVIGTANDKYSVPRKVKQTCTTHDFKLGKRSRKAKLKEIVKKEDINLSPRDLERLSERPDLRSAINDLQRFSERDSDSVDFDQREWEQSEWDAVDQQLKGEGNAEIGNGIKPEEFIHWLDENWRNNLSELDKQLRGVEVTVAYEIMSSADEFLGFAGPDNDYRYWKYATALLEMVGESRISEPYGNYIDKSYPSHFRRKQTHVEDGSAEAELYKALSNIEEGSWGIGGDFTYFKKVVLDLVQALDQSERMEVAMSARAEGKALKALNLSQDEYEDWKSGNWEENEESMGGSALDW